MFVVFVNLPVQLAPNTLDSVVGVGWNDNVHCESSYPYIRISHPTRFSTSFKHAYGWQSFPTKFPLPRPNAARLGIIDQIKHPTKQKQLEPSIVLIIILVLAVPAVPPDPLFPMHYKATVIVHPSIQCDSTLLKCRSASSKQIS